MTSFLLDIPYIKTIEHYSIKNGVRLICREAFSECVRLKNIELPSSLNFIGENAFSGCIELNEIHLPNSVVYIGDGAFDCDNMEKQRIRPIVVSIPPTLEIIDGNPFCQNTRIICDNERFKVINNVLYSADGKVLISYCSSNEEFIVPDGVVRIGVGAFRNRSIKTIRFPETLEVIDKEAFENDNLETISFPKSLKEIRRKAFDWCNFKMTCITLPPNIEKIASDAFRFDFDVKMIKVPKGSLEHYKSILPKWLSNHIYEEDYIFEHNLYLSSDKTELIVAVNGARNYLIPEGVIRVRDEAFDSIYYIDSIKLPSTLKSITREAFDKEIQELKKIIIPKGMKEKFVSMLPDFEFIIKEE